MWRCAQEKGHKTSAKVQVNDSWECSTIPFMPVFDLVREHMTGLKNADVENIMLSWTLGGYPSINLKIASECLNDPDENKYIELLKRETADKEELAKVVENEKEMALMLYNVMIKNSTVGYEAANHYCYTKSMLAEKVLNCDYILNELECC